MELLEFEKSYQDKIDNFFDIVFILKGKEFKYDPEGKHKELRNICSVYNRGNFFIVIENSNVIGTGGYKVLDLEKKIGEVKCMYIHPHYQRKGYGKKLLQKIITDAKDKSFKILKLDTLGSATNAIKLYENTGFKYIERYNDNYKADIFMQLNL